MTTNMPRDGRGTTNDPEQADKTGLPDHPSDNKAKVELEINKPGDDEITGPGTIHDPNMADRT